MRLGESRVPALVSGRGMVLTQVGLLDYGAQEKTQSGEILAGQMSKT